MMVNPSFEQSVPTSPCGFSKNQRVSPDTHKARGSDWIAAARYWARHEPAPCGGQCRSASARNPSSVAGAVLAGAGGSTSKVPSSMRSGLAMSFNSESFWTVVPYWRAI